MLFKLGNPGKKIKIKEIQKKKKKKTPKPQTPKKVPKKEKEKEKNSPNLLWQVFRSENPKAFFLVLESHQQQQRRGRRRRRKFFEKKRNSSEIWREEEFCFRRNHLSEVSDQGFFWTRRFSNHKIFWSQGFSKKPAILGRIFLFFSFGSVRQEGGDQRNWKSIDRSIDRPWVAETRKNCSGCFHNPRSPLRCYHQISRT